MDFSDAATDGRAPTRTAVDDVWLVVPLYNEDAVVGGVVAEARKTFPNVVCVDDGSTDDSAARAREAGAVVVRHAVNLGQGAALQTGIEYARAQAGARYLVTFDADGQHQVEDALAMVELARADGLAVVFGSRFLDDRTKPGFLKRLVLRAAVWFTNQSTGLRLTDAHNGLRVIRVDAAQQVDLRQDRMAHASEIVLQLGRTRLPWREHPVHVLYTDYSKGKGQSLWNSVNILVDLVFK
ncbi:glycosyltransferase family 2 protein [Cellulosimicrobium cellulans]|uniref:glycosyltransferase family 2 protein n=1 Tax=Cellulosimicrobium cellulans TaxID=1710 RepID=UPI001EDBBAD4|nr:glycosyltransferase family 2 protein [Cellulosimicrobium cellulans]UKJ65544.1 glycosyltransferase family 2 protein [Cellulosimicrobium cellulans]